MYKVIHQTRKQFVVTTRERHTSIITHHVLEKRQQIIGVTDVHNYCNQCLMKLEKEVNNSQIRTHR